MSDRWTPATARVPPRSRARQGDGTSSPTGANRTALSSGSGEASHTPWAEAAPSRQGQLLGGRCPGEDVDPRALVERDLQGEVGRGSEAPQPDARRPGAAGSARSAR